MNFRFLIFLFSGLPLMIVFRMYQVSVTSQTVKVTFRNVPHHFREKRIAKFLWHFCSVFNFEHFQLCVNIETVQEVAAEND